ncbi:MAG: SDR family oxidoreductase [Betaproteobacteria bacterium]|nr:SDR family oxidoreductase [Betaproteobacteria bacterium]
MTAARIALVTGGSRGIGAAIVRALADAGFRVAFTYRSRRAEADALCASLRDAGHEVSAIACDVADRVQGDAAVSEVVTKHGHIDVLVNNAGVHVPGVRLADLDDDDWSRVLDVNLTAPFRLARAVLPVMRRQGSGHIVNLSSNVTQRMPAGYGVYTVSKAGLEAFTRVLAKEEGPNGIRVNGVGPGPIDTDMLRETFDALGEERAAAFVNSFSLRRLGRPDEIASVVAFLVSDAASYMTGQIVYVNGGGAG